MSRRQVARAASPEAVFAQRRGETPYQIYFEIRFGVSLEISRNIESKMVDSEVCMTHLCERCFCCVGQCLCISCLANLLFVFSRTRDFVPHVCCHIMSAVSLFTSQLVFRGLNLNMGDGRQDPNAFFCALFFCSASAAIHTCSLIVRSHMLRPTRHICKNVNPRLALSATSDETSRAVRRGRAGNSASATKAGNMRCGGAS